MKHFCPGLFALAIGLGACTPRPTLIVEHPGPTTSTEIPATTEPMTLRPVPDPAKGRGDEIIRGTGSFVAAAPAFHPAMAADEAGEISLNFANADVADVAKAVLGDFLHLNYVVDASVQGAVTLQTSQKLPRAAVLPALEAAFRLSGLALLQTGDTYRIVPIADASRHTGITRAGSGAEQPGFGVEIVPLHYIGAAEMQRTLEPLAPSGSVVRVDTARNLLVIAGTSQERQAMLDNIQLFDVDWMQGMSFAVFPLHSADAKAVAAELAEIIGTKDGPLAGVVRLTAIERMNALLAISTQPRYLEALQGWVDRLDRAQASSDRHLYVYYVQNGRAKDLADVLGKALGTEGTEAPSTSAGSPPAPGPQLPAVPAPILSGLSPASQHGDATGPLDDAEAAQGATPLQKSSMRVTADETNNALLILATPAEYETVQNALLKLDTAPLQVLLEAAVAEVTLTDELSFGIQFSLKSGPGNQVLRTSVDSAAIAPALPGFSYILSSGNDIKAVLSAIDAVTHVTVLSAPDVLVLNNQTATLQVGDQVPISTQSAVSVTANNAPVINSIEYRDTGIILKVTPRVNEGGLVMMDVAQEVSDVSATTSSSLNSPTISERKINSTIAIQDSETVALGGLIKDSHSRGRSGIPLLQDIPYLGALFGDNTDSVTRTELLVLITPHVVQGVQKLRQVTDELKRTLSSTLPVFKPDK